MNIHEHQAKQILKKYGAIVPQGVFALSVDELVEKAKSLNTKKYVLKAQIHAGGRGAGKFKDSGDEKGGVRVCFSKDEAKDNAKKMFGKTLVTKQTGPSGKQVNRLYIEEASEISKACSTFRLGRPSISSIRPEKIFFLPFFSIVKSPLCIAA